MNGEIARKSRLLLITGTDTGVGKSLVTSALVYSLRNADIDAVALKPIETGISGSAEPSDTITTDGTLHRWAGGSVLSLDEVSPYRFRAPVAPVVAARLEQRTLELFALISHIDSIAARYLVTLVEGAGGLLVPITDEATFAELARALNAEVLVVAANRLGVLNHLSLTLEVIRSRGLVCAGVVINETQCERDDAAVTTNMAELQKVVSRYETAIAAHLPFMPGIPAQNQVREICSKGIFDDFIQQRLALR